MKLIGKLVLGVIAVGVVVFALANRGAVTLSLWPFPIDMQVPIYVAILGALVTGLIIGGAMSWFPKRRLRRYARTAERRAASLERRAAATPATPATTATPARQAPNASLPPAPYRPALNDD